MSTLLIIDDEPAIQHAFRRAFRAPEVTLLTASTAAEGLKLVSARKPDVVVLDLNLPDFPGLETFRRLHQLDARIPVIFITGGNQLQAAKILGITRGSLMRTWRVSPPIAPPRSAPAPIPFDPGTSLADQIPFVPPPAGPRFTDRPARRHSRAPLLACKARRGECLQPLGRAS